MTKGSAEKLFVVLVVLGAVAISGTLRAFPAGDGITIERLAEGRCLEDLDVDAAKKEGDDTAYADECVLAFTHPDKYGEEGDEAVIRLNGADVALRVTRRIDSSPKAYYELKDASGDIKVTMDLKQDCPEGLEGCNYAGTMLVESSKGRTMIRIAYCRGS